MSTDLNRKALTAMAFLAIAALAFAIYSNTFNAILIYDDYIYILNYNTTYTLSDYWPPHGTRYFGYLSFALNYLAGGFDVRGYHAVNLAIHITNGIIVFVLVRLFIRTPSLSERGLPSLHIALLAALLFISHPVQTESVTYISQRLASLATLFYLSAVALYIKWRLAEKGALKYVFYASSLVLVYVAQMTKEITYTLPFVILMVEVAFFSAPAGWRIKRLAPFFLAMALIPYFLFSMSAAHGVGGGLINDQMRDLLRMSKHDYLMTQFRVLVTFLRLLVLPVGQRIEYDYPVYDSFFVPEVFASFLLVASLFCGSIYLFWRFIKGGSAYLALISAGVFWFFTAISVESSIIPIQDVIFEHRLYLPLAGAGLAVSSAVFFAFEELGGVASVRVLMAAFIIMVLPLGAATYRRNLVWQDAVTFYKDAAAKAPNRRRVRFNLGLAYHKKGQLDEAVAEYEAAIRLQPDFEKAHLNLGIVFMDKGEYDKASYHLKEARRLNPYNSETLLNLGNLHVLKGEMDEAIESYTKALKGRPRDEDSHYNLGLAYLEKGNLAAAEEQLKAVLELNPESADAMESLGSLYEKAGDTARAEAAFQAAIKMRPDLAASLGPHIQRLHTHH